MDILLTEIELRNTLYDLKYYKVLKLHPRSNFNLVPYVNFKPH